VIRHSLQLITEGTLSHSMQVDVPSDASNTHGAFGALFAEELGLVLEVAPENEAEVRSVYEAQGLSAVAVGSTSADKGVSISVGGQASIQGTLIMRLSSVPQTGCSTRHASVLQEPLHHGEVFNGMELLIEAGTALRKCVLRHTEATTDVALHAWSA